MTPGQGFYLFILSDGLAHTSFILGNWNESHLNISCLCTLNWSYTRLSHIIDLWGVLHAHQVPFSNTTQRCHEWQRNTTKHLVPPIVSGLGWWFKWQVQPDSIMGLDTWVLELYTTRACLATLVSRRDIVWWVTDRIARARPSNAIAGFPLTRHWTLMSWVKGPETGRFTVVNGVRSIIVFTCSPRTQFLLSLNFDRTIE